MLQISLSVTLPTLTMSMTSRDTVSRGFDYHVIFTWIVGTFLVGALQPIAFELKHLIGCEHGDA